ncbi:MAG: DUF2062 domain-containing protein [Kiloniellales bacterium]|jgi:uncharacterized protein (DUF2062 family)|nr:DUF2062 domain-containing protein [Kiloniellales bacterium]
MFKRRTPLPLFHRLRELLWPRAGWRRTALYVGHRIGRLPGTPYRVAAGFACGAAISFTPFMGFHFVGAALLALVMRGNVIASAIGTAVGNPWTFPFIWLWIYNLGLWLLGDANNSHLPVHLSMHYIFDNFTKVFWPMTVGGVPTAVVAWFAFFWPARMLVLQYQRRRNRRLRRRLMKIKRKEGARLYAGQ